MEYIQFLISCIVGWLSLLLIPQINGIPVLYLIFSSIILVILLKKVLGGKE